MHNDCKYTSPAGGGGKTDTVNAGGTSVTFGHGGRHLNGTNLDISQVNQAIAQDILSRGIPFSKNVLYFDIEFAGRIIHYGAMRISDELINIGTYYIIG